MSRRRKPRSSRPAPRLDRILVKGFKAVKSSGYVDLKPLTLLIGRNGSGKSTLVEALQWLQDAYFDDLAEATHERFRAYSYLLNARSTRTVIHLEFSAATTKPSYYDLTVGSARGADRALVVKEELRVGQTAAQRTVLSTTKGGRGPVFRSVQGMNAERNANRLAIATMAAGDPAIQAVANFLERMVVLRLSPTMMRFEAPLLRFSGRMLDEEGTGLPALLASFDATQRAWVRTNVSHVLPGIRNVAVKRTERARGYVQVAETMRWRGGSREVDLPSWMLSEGTRRITALFSLLAARPRPSMLIVEEIENGLDPWTLEHVFQALRDASQEGTQVLVTTHSPFLLDHVSVEEVIHVRREKGESTYRPIANFAEVTKFRDVVAPGAMYVAGYYA